MVCLSTGLRRVWLCSTNDHMTSITTATVMSGATNPGGRGTVHRVSQTSSSVRPRDFRRDMGGHGHTQSHFCHGQ